MYSTFIVYVIILVLILTLIFSEKARNLFATLLLGSAGVVLFFLVGWRII